MAFWQIMLLAVVQGMAELLPVSSSAHVIIAAKLMGIDPSSPEFTLFLVMLHTGSMFAVILYFWNAWRERIFKSREVFIGQAVRLVAATALTAIVGVVLQKLIEKVVLRSTPNAEIEMIFGNLALISAALAAGGLLILIAGIRERSVSGEREVGLKEALWIGAVQGLCLPFRGFSRSGATGLLLGCSKRRLEEFSFALAVILTPPVVIREALRMVKAGRASGQHWTLAAFGPAVIGLVLSFLAGLLALKWLSAWLEKGRWWMFGVYCLLAAVGVLWFYLKGY